MTITHKKNLNWNAGIVYTVKHLQWRCSIICRTFFWKLILCIYDYCRNYFLTSSKNTCPTFFMNCAVDSYPLSWPLQRSERNFLVVGGVIFSNSFIEGRRWLPPLRLVWTSTTAITAHLCLTIAWQDPIYIYNYVLSAVTPACTEMSMSTNTDAYYG